MVFFYSRRCDLAHRIINGQFGVSPRRCLFFFNFQFRKVGWGKFLFLYLTLRFYLNEQANDYLGFDVRRMELKYI